MALNKEDIQVVKESFVITMPVFFCSCICGSPDTEILDQIFRSFVLIRDNFIGNSVIISLDMVVNILTQEGIETDTVPKPKPESSFKPESQHPMCSVCAFMTPGLSQQGRSPQIFFTCLPEKGSVLIP